MRTMRAKLQVMSITDHRPDSDQIDLSMMAVGGDEDNTFSRWTPSAHLTMTIKNPALFDSFHIGQKFYVDFTVADE